LYRYATKRQTQQKKNAPAAAAKTLPPPPSSAKKQSTASTPPKSATKRASPSPGPGGEGEAKRPKNYGKPLPKLQPVSNWTCTINPPQKPATDAATDAATSAAAATTKGKGPPQDKRRDSNANEASARVVRVLLPSPLDYLTRHHKTCKCKLCLKHLSKGKIKGGGGGQKAKKEAAAAVRLYKLKRSTS
jgi:hypothetical protein